MNAYKLAREFAAEEYSKKDPEFWITVTAFMKGFEEANKEKPFEFEVKGMRFYFGTRKVEVTLKNPVKVANRKRFTNELKKITKAKIIVLW